MRRILWSFALLLAVVLAGSEMAGWPFLRRPAEGLLSHRLERQVELAAPFRLHLLGSPRLHVGGIRIAMPEGFDAPHFLDAQDVAIELRYGDLLAFRKTGALRIAALDIGRIDLQFLRVADGRASWQFGRQTPERPAPLPIVERLRIPEGTLTLRDPIQQADLKATFAVREEAPGTAPTAHIEADGQFRKRPIKGRLTARGWLPIADEGGKGPPLAAKGTLNYGGGTIELNFDGEFAEQSGLADAKGTVAIKGSSLGLLGSLMDKPLPTTGPFSLTGSIASEKDTWRVNVDTATVGDSHLSGQFVFDPNTTPPRLDGQLSGRRFVLADLAPAFGTRNEDGTPFKPPPGRVIPNRPLDLPSLKKLDAHIKVNLDHVDLGRAFAQPIAPLQGTLSLKQGLLSLSDLDAVTAKGTLRGSVSIDARQSSPLWRFDLAWDGIHLQDWLKAGKGADNGERRKSAEAGRPPYITGTLHGRARLSGNGQSTAKLLASMDGDITAFVRNGTLSHLVVEILGLDVAQGLGLVLSGDESLPIRCAVVDLQAKQGMLRPKVALVDTPVTLILSDGRIDLAKESLDLRITARPKNVSPLTLRSPIDIRGSFNDPTVTPEAGPIAARILGGIALAFANPLAAIIPFIDPGDQVGSPCNQSLTTLKR